VVVVQGTVQLVLVLGPLRGRGLIVVKETQGILTRVLVKAVSAYYSYGLTVLI
jgi:hypothetical protein